MSNPPITPKPYPEKPEREHAPTNEIRIFVLSRSEDVSGVSGTGIVAEGVQFSTGKCVLAWTTKYRSVAVYDSIDELIAIHGHDGKTRIEWRNKREDEPHAP